MFNTEYVIRDLALIEVMRKCKFVVDPGALYVYATNTYQDSIVGPAAFRNECQDCHNDDIQKITKLYEPYVKKYLVDAWKSCYCGIQRREGGDGFCTTTNSFATALQGIPKNSLQFATTQTLANMISGLASSLISSHENLFKHGCSAPNKVRIPNSDVWKLYELIYMFEESIKFRDADEQTILDNINALCDVSMLYLYIRPSLNTIQVAQVRAWNSRLELRERCGSPEYRQLVNSAVKYSTYSPEAILAMDLASIKSKDDWRDYYARSNNQIPEDTPEFRYLLSTLRILEMDKNKGEYVEDCCCARG